MTNFTDYKPTREGEVVVYRSPQAASVLLVDIAEVDRYGRLRFVAVPHDSPVAVEALQFAVDVDQLMEVPNAVRH